MNRLLLGLPLLALASCATNQRPYAPVRDVAYQAMGQEPFWQVVIGDDRIHFRPVAGGGARSWPRVLPRTVDGVRIWQTGTGPEGITISARPGPCHADGRGGHVPTDYADFVTVRMGADGPELHGCGGRIIARDLRRHDG